MNLRLFLKNASKHCFESISAVICLLVVIFFPVGQIGRVVELRSKAASPGFRFISWADTKSATSVLASLSKQAYPLSPAFTIYPGDLESAGFTTTSMNAWKTAINGNSNNGVFDKTFPTRGNHDSSNTPGWQAYFNMRATVSRRGGANYRYLADNLTYSFDYGTAHFIGVDVLGDATLLTSNQISWIDNDLTAAESRGMTRAFLFFHAPLYCVAEHCSCTVRTCSTNANIKHLISVINKHPIVLATFHGHEHIYDYIHIDNTRIPEVTHPFEEFITGDAGAKSAGCAKTYRFDYCMNSHGFATVDVSDSSFTVSFYALGNTTPNKTFTFKITPGYTARGF